MVCVLSYVCVIMLNRAKTFYEDDLRRGGGGGGGGGKRGRDSGKGRGPPAKKSRR